MERAGYGLFRYCSKLMAVKRLHACGRCKIQPGGAFSVRGNLFLLLTANGFPWITG